MTETTTSLVFEGGGSLGLAYVGALRALEDHLTNTIARVAGSSAGSIMALCIALGYKSSELLVIMSQYDFNKFKDDSWGIARDARRLFKRYGLYKGDTMLKWLRGLVASKLGGDGRATFQELYSRTRNAIELTVTTTNLNRRKTAYWSVHNTPAMEVALAVRMSCSIPIMFKPVVFEGDIHVDGGVLLNYPLSILENRPGDRIIGLKIVRPNEQRNDDISSERRDIDSLYGFVDAIIKSMMLELERRDVNDDYWARTVTINTFGLSSTDFDISDEDKTRLYDSGRDAMGKYLGERM